MKKEIKAWLRASGRDREWLGGQLGVAKKTVDNWLSSPKEIPTGKLTLIQRLMQDDAAAEARRSLALLPQSQIFSLEVDLPTYRAYSAAALADQRTLEQWAIHELNQAAANAPASVKPRPTYEPSSYPSPVAAEESPLTQEATSAQDEDHPAQHQQAS